MKHFIFFILALALTVSITSCEKETPAEPIDDIVNPDPDPDPDPETVDPSDFEVEAMVSPNQIREVCSNLKDAGYMPTFIDGFTHRAGNSTQQYDETMYNVVFAENKDELKWQVFTDQSEQQLMNKFSDYLIDGYRTLHLESYLKNDERVYAVIFVEGSPSDQYYVIGKKSSDYQSIFNAKVAQGYRLVNRSILHVDGEKYVTALFDEEPINDWQAFSNLSEEGVQAKMEENNQAGRVATYLDIAQVNTTDNVLYSPIFADVPHDNWYALNKLDQDEMKDALNAARENGYEVTFICGYDEPGLINGNEVNFLRFAVGFKK